MSRHLIFIGTALAALGCSAADAPAQEDGPDVAEASAGGMAPAASAGGAPSAGGTLVTGGAGGVQAHGGGGAATVDGSTPHPAEGGTAGGAPITGIPGTGVYKDSDEVWPSPVAPGAPPASTDFVDAVFTGRHKEYLQADTWYPSWGSDDILYSNVADGNVMGVGVHSYGDFANTGRVKIIGSDPLALTFANAHTVAGFAGAGYNMRYPVANLIADGVWYSATSLRNALGEPGCAYTCTEGALVGFDYTTKPSTASTDTDWVKTKHTPAAPLFPETGLGGSKVKFAEPHFVDFGKNLEHSPDGKAYLVAHGAAANGDFVNWNSGSDIYVARITPSPANIDDLAKWEFFKGNDAGGSPIWSSGFTGLVPILSWKGQLGNVSITYDAPLHRYVMTLSRGNRNPDDWNRSDFLVLHSASDSLTGGWRLVRVWHDFGTFGYMPNVPSKFLSADGMTFWMGFSTDNGHRGGVVTNPVGATYSYDLREVRLIPSASGKGSLSASVGDSATSVDLAAEGTSDWAHWGKSGFPGEDRKQNGEGQLKMTNAASMFSGVTKVGCSSGTTAFNWSGGTPTASATAMPSGICANDTNSGFTLSALADTKARTLKVYVRVSKARGELHAYLSDNSATPYRDVSLSDETSARNGVYTVTYRAGAEGQRLYVTWSNAKDFSTDFSTQVSLQAASLSGGN